MVVVDLSPLYPPKKSQLPAATAVNTMSDSDESLLADTPRKRGRRRSSSLHRQDSNGSFSHNKKPVPGITIGVIGSPRSKIPLLGGKDFSLLSLEETSPEKATKVESKFLPRRRYGDQLRDYEREHAFAQFDDDIGPQ